MDTLLSQVGLGDDGAEMMTGVEPSQVPDPVHGTKSPKLPTVIQKLIMLFMVLDEVKNLSFFISKKSSFTF